MISGLLNLVKPPGLTSHDAVQQVRRLFHERRVGHTGTLDPGAAGVLVVCLGEATKAIAFMEDETKEYWGEAVLGSATFTQDAEGEVTETAPSGWTTTPARVAEEASRLCGEVEQAAPLVSAVHQEGRRLYELAREGQAVARPVRRVKVEQFTVEEMLPGAGGRYGAGARLRFRVACSRGTYIRALVDDLGRALGGFAHLAFLIRLRSGPFQLADGVTLEELAAEEAPDRRLLGVDAGLTGPALLLSGEAERRFLTGAAVKPEGQAFRPGRVRVYRPPGGSAHFLGMGQVEPDGTLRPLRIFHVGEEPEGS
ncbi:MAG: tRNA pseudouridine(55) synthase TruB [Chitinophagales bacterium]